MIPGALARLVRNFTCAPAIPGHAATESQPRQNKLYCTPSAHRFRRTPAGLRLALPSIRAPVAAGRHTHRRPRVACLARNRAWHRSFSCASPTDRLSHKLRPGCRRKSSLVDHDQVVRSGRSAHSDFLASHRAPALHNGGRSTSHPWTFCRPGSSASVGTWVASSPGSVITTSDHRREP